MLRAALSFRTTLKDTEMTKRTAGVLAGAAVLMAMGAGMASAAPASVDTAAAASSVSHKADPWSEKHCTVLKVTPVRSEISGGSIVGWLKPGQPASYVDKVIPLVGPVQYKVAASSAVTGLPITGWVSANAVDCN